MGGDVGAKPSRNQENPTTNRIVAVFHRRKKPITFRYQGEKHTKLVRKHVDTWGLSQQLTLVPFV
jgi:hypothetical protein